MTQSTTSSFFFKDKSRTEKNNDTNELGFYDLISIIEFY